jgi:hypothetical protein
LRSRESLRSKAPHQPDFPIPARRLRRAATQAGALSAMLRQPEPSQCWQLNVSQLIHQGPGPWARLEILTRPVEACRPLSCRVLNPESISRKDTGIRPYTAGPPPLTLHSAPCTLHLLLTLHPAGG